MSVGDQFVCANVDRAVLIAQARAIIAMSNEKSTKESKGFWEKLIGPSREEVWGELSKQIDSTIVSKGLFGPVKLQVEHDNWTITLDTFRIQAGHDHHVVTRIRAPLKGNNGFQFCIAPQTFISTIGVKLLGFQDVIIGHPLFDEKFVVQGTDELRLRELLSSDEIRRLLSLHEDGIEFALKDDEGWFGTQFPDGVDELYFAEMGEIKDVAKLKALFDLFAETLDQLAKMGLASTDNPGVKL